MHPIEGKRILITGGYSMIGRACAKLLSKSKVCQTSHADLDMNQRGLNVNLLDYDQTLHVLREYKPHYVIHCAGFNGNIAFNSKYPADIYFRTLQMGMNVYRACERTPSVMKVVTPLSSCAYPNNEGLLTETMFSSGSPHESVEGHGLAKRALFDFGRQISKQFNGIRFVSLIFNTVYGPHDCYDLNKTKVVGALIKKFADAVRDKERTVTIWGTGRARREIIYCEDAAKGIIEVLKHYDDISLPINIGCGSDHSIQEIAEYIAYASGFLKHDESPHHRILNDETRPDGQMVKLLDNRRMLKLLPDMKFGPKVANLMTTIKWYKDTFHGQA